MFTKQVTNGLMAFGLLVATICSIYGFIKFIPTRIDIDIVMAEVDKANERLDFHIDNDERKAVQQAIWEMQRYYKCRDIVTCGAKMPDYEFSTYQRLLLRLDDLNKKLGVK